MKPSLAAVVLCLSGAFLVLSPPRPALRAEKQQPDAAAKKTVKVAGYAWTPEEAAAQLQLHPRDPFLQYALLQWERRQQPLDMPPEREPAEDMFGANRREGLDLFSLFSGTLAIQESLQRDALTRRRSAQRPEDEPIRMPWKLLPIADLAGPTIRAHPWETMLAGKKPEISRLSRCVPDDFFFAEFRSVSKLLQCLEVTEQWGQFLQQQSLRDSSRHPTRERIERQLALETGTILRLFADAVIDEIAITGSDLMIREGSDVSVLFRYSRPEVFQKQMDLLLVKAAEAHPDIQRNTGRTLGVDYMHVASPDRSVCAYAAYPEPGLYVRSNSAVALERVLEAVKGRKADGSPVRRLGETAEFQYLRTLLPRGAAEEDGFVYLSDPFLRHFVGPQLRITERRRLLCFNHLRMIGHAAQLYRNEQRKNPPSLEALTQADCSPKINFTPIDVKRCGLLLDQLASPRFDLRDQATADLKKMGEGVIPHLQRGLLHAQQLEVQRRMQGLLNWFSQRDVILACPSGGKYSLGDDRQSARCSHHGHAHFMTPCCEIPITEVTAEEAELYKQFLEDYNQHWREYFDPIALRIQINPKRFRVETVILPLIDNSIYTAMAKAFGGPAELLDALPVPVRNLFSLNVRLRDELFQELESSAQSSWVRGKLRGELAFVPGLGGVFALSPQLGFPAALPGPATLDASPLQWNGDDADVIGDYFGSVEAFRKLKFQELLSKGLARQFGLHVYDQALMFDMNWALLGAGAAEERYASLALMMYGFYGAAFLAPAYLSAPVRDPKVVDEFLERLDNLLPNFGHKIHAEMDRLRDVYRLDFYKLTANGNMKVRSIGIRYGPLRFRFFIARIGNGLYIANQPSVLEDLRVAEAVRTKAIAAGQAIDRGPSGHALIRLRPLHWNLALPGFRLGWAENNREACLNNLGPLSSAARAFAAEQRSKPDASSWNDLPRRYAENMYGLQFYCPDDGSYQLSPDGKSVSCSLHGSGLEPRQADAPAKNSNLERLMRDFADMTATLTFLKDGLRAVVVIDRK